MQRILFVLILLMQIATAHASWNVETKTDSMTDEIKKTAKIVNAEGHSLSVYRLPNGRVWVNFSLSNQSLDQLSPQKTPIFRVDKNEPRDIADSERLQAMGIQAFDWEPKWVNFLIWHGKESDGRSKTLDELMQGKSVVFRYYIFTGGYKETTFSLDGADRAIASALGSKARADKTTAERAEEFKRAYFAAVKTCTKDESTYRTCLERGNSCRKQSNDDLATFQQCMQ